MKTIHHLTWLLFASPFLLIGFVGGWIYRAILAGNELSDMLWTEDKTPEGEMKETVDSYSRLRKAIEAATLETSQTHK